MALCLFIANSVHNACMLLK